MSDFETHPIGTANRLKRLEALLGDVLKHPSVVPCICGKPDCLTGRIKAELERR